MSTPEQVETAAMALAVADGATWEHMDEKMRELFRTQSRVVLDSVPRRVVTRTVSDEAATIRRIAVMGRAFEAGVPMERALREAEPDLSRHALQHAKQIAYVYDAHHDNALHGAGAWERRGNEDVVLEVQLITRTGEHKRWRFASIEEAVEWVGYTADGMLNPMSDPAGTVTS